MKTQVNRNPRGLNRRGFTLVELLVIISIIALLVAILVPSLSKARVIARQVTCAANLRKVQVAYMTYAAENRQRTIPCNWHTWDGDDARFWTYLLEPYGFDREESLCPNMKLSGLPADGKTSTGSTSRTWASKGHTTLGIGRSSVAINGWIYSSIKQPNTTKVGAYDSLMEPSQPARTPMFLDSIWADGWPESSDEPPADLITGPLSNQMGRYCRDFHDGATTVVFISGNSETVRLADLWKLRWNEDFDPRDVEVP